MDMIGSAMVSQAMSWLVRHLFRFKAEMWEDDAECRISVTRICLGTCGPGPSWS